MTMLDVTDDWRSYWEIDGWLDGRATLAMEWHTYRGRTVRANLRPLAYGQRYQQFFDQKAGAPRLEQYPGAAAALIHAELADSVRRHMPRTTGRAIGREGQGEWPLGGWSWTFPRRF